MGLDARFWLNYLCSVSGEVFLMGCEILQWCIFLLRCFIMVKVEPLVQPPLYFCLGDLD